MTKMTVDEYMETIEEQRRAPGRKIEAIEKRLEQIAATVETTTDIDAIEKLYTERDGLQDKLEPMREAFTQHWVGFAPLFSEYFRYKELRHMTDAQIRSAHLPEVRVSAYSLSTPGDYPEFSRRIQELREFLKEEPVLRDKQIWNKQREERANPWYRKLFNSTKGGRGEEVSSPKALPQAMNDYSHLAFYFAEHFRSRAMTQQTYDLLMHAPFGEIYERIDCLPREKQYPKSEKEKIDL